MWFQLRSVVPASLVLLLALLLVPGAARAQAPARTARNAFYLELGGNAILYSLNYDRLFTDRVSGRVGVMFFGAADKDSSAGVVATPIMASYLWGEGNSRFETGAGLLLVSGGIDNVEGYEDEGFGGAAGTATLGYRYQRPAGGFVFRAGVTPVFSLDGIAPWFGISFGYSF
jgi:hypothetical protein